MGFKEVKTKVIKCLESGNYDHEVRNEIDIKNLLATGQLTDVQTIRLINKTNGTQYEASPYHGNNKSIMVHLFKPVDAGKTWYIKFYFLEPDTVFISVH
jgi:hypothetical protein